MSRMHVVRKIQFCAGHRVKGHENRCRYLHGHNYEAHFFAVAEAGLDALGRVIDFGILKERLGGWIDEHWDHAMVLWAEDREALDAVSGIPGQRIALLDSNPTAENMARVLLDEVAPRALAGTGVRVVRVVLWETPNCRADVREAGRAG